MKILRVVAFSVFLAAAAAGASASERTLPALDHFFRDAALQSMRLSPSGRWLVAQTGGGGLRVRLVAIDLEGKEPTQVIAVFSASDVASFDWIDDDWLTFDVASPDDMSGKRRGAGLLAVRRDGRQMRLLIKRRYDQEVQARDSRALSPAHGVLDLGNGTSPEIVVGEWQYDSRDEVTHVTPRLLDVSSGAVRSLPMAKPPENARYWWFDPSGRPRIVGTVANGRTAIYWTDRQGQAWRRIAEFADRAAPFWPEFIDADDHLYVTADDGPTGQARLHRFGLGGNKRDPKPVVTTAGYDANVTPILDRRSGAMHGMHVLTEGRGTVWLEPAMQQIQAGVDNALPGRINLLSCRPCDKPKVVLVHSYSDRDPGRFYLIRPGAQSRLEPLGAVRPEIAPEHMARLEHHRASARDGRPLPLWITAAPQTEPKPRPAVVLVHGGPWIRGVEREWRDEAQFLASRGYVVIEPEFRGSTGYGTEHYRAGWKQWGRGMQDDVTDALRFAVDRGLVDPKRVCIAGASYGGCSALVGPGRDPGQYRCAIAWVAVTDPRMMFTVHWSDLSSYTKQFSLPELIGDPKSDAAMLAAHAPLELASRIKSPVFLAYGGKDLRVPLVHGEKMRDALRDAGNPPEWVVYDSEGHGWQSQANRIDFWTRAEAFLERHLQPKSP